jgi:hypothetical protein
VNLSPPRPPVNGQLRLSAPFQGGVCGLSGARGVGTDRAGLRPLQPASHHDASCFRDILYGSDPSVNGYYKEISYNKFSFSDAAIDKAARLPAADENAAEVAAESTWIDESFQAAQKSVYTKPVGVGPGPFKLDAPYKANARKLAADRVELAGARLANLINEALR